MIRSIPLLLALVPLALASCGEESLSGDLTVRYAFSGVTRTCEAAAVATVRVNLDNEVFEEAPCNLETGITLSGVPAKAYSRMVVQGVSAEGVAVMDNLAGLETDESVEVLGESTQEVPVELSPTPVDVRFSFAVLAADGLPYAQLEDPLVDSFVVSAFEDGAYDLLTYEFVYDALTSVRNVSLPDPNRALRGNDLDALTIDVYARDRTVLAALEFSFVPPGPGRIIDVLLECRGGTCTGSLTGATLVDP